MAQIIKVVRYWGTRTDGTECCFNEVRECPLCHHAIKPEIFDLWFLDDHKKLGVVYFCPGCNNIFLATYLNPEDDLSGEAEIWYENEPYLAPHI